MPTITQLPAGIVPSPQDEVPISQNGVTRAVSVAALLSRTQPAINAPTNSLLGRVSPGVGGPETVAIGHGLAVSNGQIAATGSDHAIFPLATQLFSTDEAVLNRGGQPARLQVSALRGMFTAGTNVAIDANGVISIPTGSVEGTVTAGNDPRVTGAEQVGNKGQAGGYAPLDTTGRLPSAYLTGVDTSTAAIRGSVPGAVVRALSSWKDETRSVGDFGATGDGVADDTAAFVAGVAWLNNTKGRTLFLPAGVYNIASLVAPLAIASGATIKGAGMHRTRLVWDDNDQQLNLFTSTGNSGQRAVDIAFEDLTITGGWALKGVTSQPGNYPFLLYYVDGLTFRNVCSEYSRVMGIAARNCTVVTAQNCVVRYAGRDGINFAECANVSILNNIVEHCDDDGIAAHSDTSDPWGVRRNIVISGNRLFDCQGIKVLSARNFAIVGNVVDCCRAQGIMVNTVQADGSTTEGVAATAHGLIAGNVLTNIISRQNVDGRSSGNPGILITGSSARAGSAGSIPGEANTSTGTVIDPYPYFAVNSAQASVPTPGSFGIIVSGNLIARTLPPCNGSVSNPAGGLYAKWSDLGFGQMFTRGGWVDPHLAESDLRGDAIEIWDGVVRDVLVTGNIVRGMNSGLYVGAGTRFENIVYRGNEIVDCFSWGICINTNAILRTYIEDNLFDLDPYHKHPARGSNGTWTALGDPTCFKAQAGSGVAVRRNVLRNLCRDSDVDSSNAVAGWLFEENVLEADPIVAGGFSSQNKGVGLVRPSGGTCLIQVDSDPASASYGKVLQAGVSSATACPSAGKWLQGHYIKNAQPTITGGQIVLGWVRLTTGTGSTLGTDWATVTAPATGSAASVLTFPVPQTGSAAQWVLLGTFTAAQGGDHATVRLVANAGYNALSAQIEETVIHFATSNGGGDANGFAGASVMYRVGRAIGAPSQVKWMANAPGSSATSFSLYVYLSAWAGQSSLYTVATGTGQWLHIGTSGQSDPGTAGPAVCVPTEEWVLESPASFMSSVSVLGSMVVGAGGSNLAVLSGSATGQPVALRAQGSDLNVGVSIIPQGSGAIAAAIADGTVAGGASRGAYAVDLQTSRTASTQVSSGSGAVIAGGQNNSAGGTCSFAAGYGNSLSGNYGAAPGGASANDRGLSGRLLWASGCFGSCGDAQTVLQTMRVVSSGGGIARLTADGGAASSSNTASLGNNMSARFSGKVVARDILSGSTSCWSVEFCLKRGLSAAATVLVGQPIVTQDFYDAGASAWTLCVAADVIIGGPAITVAGAAGLTLHVVQSLFITEAQ